MSIKKTNIARILRHLLSLAAALLLVGCGVGPSHMAAPKLVVKQGEADTEPRPYDHGQKKEETPPQNGRMNEHQLREAIISFGIRDFGQINETMAVVTGVDPMTRVNSQGQQRTIQSIFLELSNQLPESNDAKTFLASNQVAISKLGVEYCDALMQSQQLRVQVAPNFNFGANASVAFDGANRSQFIAGLLDQFWGPARSDLPDRDQTVSELSNLIDDLLASSNAASAQTTLDIARGICTAVIASAPVTFL